MKYHIQDPSGKWLAGYTWDGEDWITSWSKDRDGAKPISSSDIAMIKDALEKGCKGYKAEWVDRRAPDGVVSLGRRRVSKKGTVRFAGDTFRHDKLMDFVGQYVFVEAEDYWIVRPHAFKTSAGFADGKENHICDLEGVK
jgi:hypothetical protein